MNPRQVLMQARYLLRNRNWSETSGTRVFPSVHATLLPTSMMRNLRRPMVLLRPGTEKPDPQRPGRGMFTVDFELVVGVSGDQVGENALLGANVADVTKSEGKGLFWTEREVKAVLRQMETDSGIRIIGRRTGAQRVTVERDAASEAAKVYEVTFDVSDEPYYHPPKRLAGADIGAGHVLLTWTDPPARFDTISSSSIMIRRNANSTPPATISEGTLVATVSRGLQTYDVGALLAGTHSFSIFAAYTDGLNSAVYDYSVTDPTARTSVVVA